MNTIDADRAGSSRSGSEPVDPHDLSNAALDALLHDLQKRAFEIYEDAALRAEANPAIAATAYERAERDAAPLIAQARTVNDERVRRLRRRARLWRRLAIAVAIVGAVAVIWLAMRP